MNCPKCGSDQLKVIDSRGSPEQVKRRRECVDCKERFSTIEVTVEKYETFGRKIDYLRRVITEKVKIDNLLRTIAKKGI